jgi:hypothetical protein
MFDEDANRADFQRLEGRDVAEADSQGFLWPDALCTPALRTGLGIGVGSDPGPPHLDVCRGR